MAAPKYDPEAVDAMLAELEEVLVQFEKLITWVQKIVGGMGRKSPAYRSGQQLLAKMRAERKASGKKN